MSATFSVEVETKRKKKEQLMKIIFVLDDQTVLVSNPEELQLRQVEAGLAALVIPAGKNEKGEELFRPLITYPVVLMALPPKPDDSISVGEASVRDEE